MPLYNDQIAATAAQYGLTDADVAIGACVTSHTVRAWRRPVDSAGWRRARPERAMLLLAWIDRENIKIVKKESKQ